jgi:hypothetical protein
MCLDHGRVPSRSRHASAWNNHGSDDSRDVPIGWGRVRHTCCARKNRGAAQGKGNSIPAWHDTVRWELHVWPTSSGDSWEVSVRLGVDSGLIKKPHVVQPVERRSPSVRKLPKDVRVRHAIGNSFLLLSGLRRLTPNTELIEGDSSEWH